MLARWNNALAGWLMSTNHCGSSEKQLSGGHAWHSWKQLATHSVPFISHAINQNAFSFSPLAVLPCSAHVVRVRETTSSWLWLGGKVIKKVWQLRKVVASKWVVVSKTEASRLLLLLQVATRRSPQRRERVKNNLEPERNMRMEQRENWCCNDGEVREERKALLELHFLETPLQVRGWKSSKD